MKTIRIALLALAMSMVIPSVGNALENATGNREAINMGLYPPDLLMRHQQRLGITKQQRKRIAAEVKKFQSDIADLQWTLQDEQQILRQALGSYPIPAQKTLRHAEKVLTLESQFKLAHFTLLIAIKNELTPEQVELLDQNIKQRKEQRNAK